MNLTKILRKVDIASATWATNTWTVNTSVPHYLVTGDVVKFIDPVNPQSYEVTVTVSDADTFTFASTDAKIKFPVSMFLDVFGTGATGAQDTFSFKMSDTVNGLIHIVSNGTGTVTVKAQGSLDGTHWVDIGTATAVTAGSQFEIAVTKPYPYGRLNFTVAVASAATTGNNIKAYRAGC
jgi:hypothetical protein